MQNTQIESNKVIDGRREHMQPMCEGGREGEEEGGVVVEVGLRAMA